MIEISDSRLRKARKAVVALSGGVDSAFAAFFLQEQGLEVTGVFFKMFPEKSKLSRHLPLKKQQQNLERVERLAKELNIRFFAVDVSSDFEKEVIRKFIKVYLKGRTPNPCVLCNPGIKFAHLLNIAKELGADIIATGHYARIVQRENFYSLLKAIDKTKDQSYYLYLLDQDKLAFIFLPNGYFLKKEVKEKMSQLLKSISFEEESQEVCFIEKDYREFLRQVAPEAIKPGDFVLKDGTVVGKHKGIAFYTVGQRRGLGLSLGKKMYVIGINAQSNQVVLGEEKDLYPERIVLESVHFIRPPASNYFECKIKARFRSPDVSCQVKLRQEGEAEVKFLEKCAFPAPGQSAVFYIGEEVIGGGIIAKWL
jgi:tRNA-specific 2-thiouridylase